MIKIHKVTSIILLEIWELLCKLPPVAKVRDSGGDGSKPWYLVNPKIAGKWMFIPLKMYL